MTQVKFLNSGTFIDATTNMPYPDLYSNASTNGYVATLILKNNGANENTISLYLQHGIISNNQLIDLNGATTLYDVKIPAYGQLIVTNVHIPANTRLVGYGFNFNWTVTGLEYPAE